MKTTFGRTCLVLALLSFSLATAVSVNARHNGIVIEAGTTGMQLQSSPDADEVAAAPDADERDNTAMCTLRDCPSPEQELALARIDQEPVFARIDAPQPHEGKAFTVPGDEVQPKSKD